MRKVFPILPVCPERKNESHNGNLRKWHRQESPGFPRPSPYSGNRTLSEAGTGTGTPHTTSSSLPPLRSGFEGNCKSRREAGMYRNPEPETLPGTEKPPPAGRFRQHPASDLPVPAEPGGSSANTALPAPYPAHPPAPSAGSPAAPTRPARRRAAQIRGAAPTISIRKTTFCKPAYGSANGAEKTPCTQSPS